MGPSVCPLRTGKNCVVRAEQTDAHIQAHVGKHTRNVPWGRTVLSDTENTDGL